MNDIPQLYKRFDGTPSDYQELRRQELATDATARWPLIAAMASAPVVLPPRVVALDAQASQAVADASQISGALAPAMTPPMKALIPAARPPHPTRPSRPTSRFMLRLAAAWRAFKQEEQA